MAKSLIGKILARHGDTTTTPVPYVSAGPAHYVFSGSPGGTDFETYMRTYGTAGTIYAIVTLLATSVGKPEWRLYRKQTQDGRVRYTTGDKGSDQRTEVVKHAALDVWNAPNPFYTRQEFVETWQQHIELTGNAYGVVVRDSHATFPIGLWPVRPDRIEPVPHPEKFLAGYIYTSPDGQKIPLEVQDVLHMKLPNPLSPYVGIGPVQSILVDIDAMKYGAEWNRNFFINSATPGGIITFPNSLGDEEFNQFSDRWRESHQGVSRGHRVAILESGATWTNAQYSMKDMEFSNLRGVSRDVIREAWGIHKAMLGNSDDVNRANAQTAQEVYGRWQVLPRLDRVKMILNERFLPMFGSTGQGVEFDYVNPLPDDREADNAELTSKATAAQLLVSAGFDPEDVCEVVGLPPMGFKPPPKPVAPPAQTGELEESDNSQGEPAEDDNQTEDSTGGSGSPDTPSKPANRSRYTIRTYAAAKPSPDLTAVDQQWHEITAEIAEKYTNDVIPAQQQQLLDQIKKSIDAGDLAALGSLKVDTAVAVAILYAAMNTYADTAAHQAADEASDQNATATPTTPPAKTLKTIATVVCALMASELAVSAGRAALQAAAPGQSGTQVADVVGDFLDTLSPATRQAHLGGAMSAVQNASRLATFLTGPPCQLIASEINDKNTCTNCRDIDGTTFGLSTDPSAVDAARAAYPSGGYVNCSGGDRCRGTLIAEYVDSSSGSSDDGGDSGGDIVTNEFMETLLDFWHNGSMGINGYAKVGA